MTNIGTILYIIMVYISLIIIERLWNCLVLKFGRSKPYYLKLSNFLYWTGLNTLATEAYLDIGLAATLNIHTMEWLDNNPDLFVTNIFAIACLTYIIVYPIWVLRFYSNHHVEWKQDSFKK